MAIHIGIVAGESSGDQLGGAIITALRNLSPDIRITAMAGPKMADAGCEVIADTDELAVMGLVEVLRKYPSLRRLRNRICDFYLQSQPDVFVGIDVPDFALGIEGRLRAAGIKTAHCVAPQIWAWRQSRAKRIADKVDLLLTLFPFEVPFYERYDVNTTFIGHPVADQFAMMPDLPAARRRLGLDQDRFTLALMPGSRRQEWIRHVDLFLESARLFSYRVPRLQLVVGATNSTALDHLRSRANQICADLDVIILEAKSHDVLLASDLALCASGTVTMECLFARTPAVVAYRISPVTYSLMKAMVKVPFIAMPNILAERELMPEFLQRKAQPRMLTEALENWRNSPQRIEEFERRCREIHTTLRTDASARAARAILEIVGCDA